MKDRHKVRIRKITDGAKTYTEWQGSREDKVESDSDILSSENRWEGHSPFAQIPLSDIESDRLEELQNLYPTLKGRQKQIVALLFDGLTSQTEIAKRLSMSQSNVHSALKRIMKKILKNTI